MAAPQGLWSAVSRVRSDVARRLRIAGCEQQEMGSHAQQQALLAGLLGGHGEPRDPPAGRGRSPSEIGFWSGWRT